MSCHFDMQHAPTHASYMSTRFVISPQSSFLPPHVQVLRYYYCRHARTPRGTKVSCCFAPTGQFLCLLSFIPALLVAVRVVVRRNLNKLVRLCFWRARCAYRTILAYHVCAQSTSYVELRTPKSSHVQAGLRIWERGYTVHVPTMSFIGNECTFTL